VAVVHAFVLRAGLGVRSRITLGCAVSLPASFDCTRQSMNFTYPTASALQNTTALPSKGRLRTRLTSWSNSRLRSSKPLHRQTESSVPDALHAAIIPLTVECSKLGWIGLRFGFGLSGVTPGHLEWLTIRRESAAARRRRLAHARSDSLEHSAVVPRPQENAQIYAPGCTGEIDSRRRDGP